MFISRCLLAAYIICKLFSSRQLKFDLWSKFSWLPLLPVQHSIRKGVQFIDKLSMAWKALHSRIKLILLIEALRSRVTFILRQVCTNMPWRKLRQLNYKEHHCKPYARDNQRRFRLSLFFLPLNKDKRTEGGHHWKISSASCCESKHFIQNQKDWHQIRVKQSRVFI